MDKNKIKKFAIWARRELIERIAQKAMAYGISENEIIPANVDSVSDRVLSVTEKQQRQVLITEIEHKGYAEVIEEVAYTWFNRFTALRFMEVNGYLPSRVRVFTDAENNFKPQILDEALNLDLPRLDKDKVFAYKEANETGKLYKYLLITQCNALSSVLPGMFQKLADYTELLLPDNLLREGNVIEQMITLIPENNWDINVVDDDGNPQGQVEIIGWLYQYYNTEKKNSIFDALKKNIKVAKENIPAATQLFTPDWIVHYMVENSLGRLWIEGHPNEDLKSNWKYYLDEAEQKFEVEAQLKVVRNQYAALKPQDIKIIDPSMGSGHVLVYIFDVLMQIYSHCGYNNRDAVRDIIENNLHGLDIDERAAQLAYFSVMMKARQYDRRFFTRNLQPKVYPIYESNNIDLGVFEQFGDETDIKSSMLTLVNELKDAKEYGSIINISRQNWNLLYEFAEKNIKKGTIHSDLIKKEILPLLELGRTLTSTYDVVVTNPPYMGNNSMNHKLADYVKKNFKNSKSDLFAVFMEKWNDMLNINGYQAMITQHSWMFLTSFEEFRRNFLNGNIVNLLHLGIGIFQDLNSKVVQSVAYTYRKTSIEDYIGIYHRLFEKQGLQEKTSDKIRWLLTGEHKYYVKNSSFFKIPGNPIAYWVSSKFIDTFKNGISVSSIGKYTGSQNITSDNNKYLRFIWEVNNSDIGENRKWAFYIKGGPYRKWYGNIDLLVNWSLEAQNYYKSNSSANLLSKEYRFREGITYTELTTGINSFRFLPPIAIFDKKGPCIVDLKYQYYCLGFFNSKVAVKYFNVLNPSITLQVKDVKNTPLIIKQECMQIVENIVKNCVHISQLDWNYFEISHDFKCSPLIKFAKNEQNNVVVSMNYSIKFCYYIWKERLEKNFVRLKYNEEKLNTIFIDIYGLQEEITPEVEDKDITVHLLFDDKENIPESMCNSKYVLTKQDVIKNFISYAVGCMFGRYTLDVEGLVYAGGEWDESKYPTFVADADNIIPICDDEYFEDDIVGRFVKFVEVVYGRESLEDNLRFIADALGGSGQSRDVIRKYFISDFYKDHCKMYQKRPIYWLFDSGKKNGFKCLIYMHRYQPDTIARIRTDYVHEQQGRYRTAIEDLQNRMNTVEKASEKVKMKKALQKLEEKDTELRSYEEKIHHLADQMISIDLDDGVKHNYEIFKDVLAKIK